MKSYWKRRSCLFAVLLAIAGMGLGTWGPAAQAAGNSTTQVSSVTAIDFVSGAFVSLEELGDGTAQAFVSAYLSPTVFLGLAFYPPADYEISAYVQPGQSGQGDGYGTAHFELESVFAFDFATGMPVGPLDVIVDIAVADPTTVSASSSQGVTAQFNVLTGETSIVREHRIGNQALGDTAGSLSISVDDGGGFVPVAEATEVLGMVGVTNVHIIEQIH